MRCRVCSRSCVESMAALMGCEEGAAEKSTEIGCCSVRRITCRRDDEGRGCVSEMSALWSIQDLLGHDWQQGHRRYGLSGKGGSVISSVPARALLSGVGFPVVDLRRNFSSPPPARCTDQPLLLTAARRRLTDCCDGGWLSTKGSLLSLSS